MTLARADAPAIALGARLLREGRLVAFPTEDKDSEAKAKTPGD